MNESERLATLEQIVQQLVTKRIGKNNIIPGSIQQSHISANAAIIVFDKAANRPTAGSNFLMAFFATDTNAFSIWNGTAWKSVTLT